MLIGRLIFATVLTLSAVTFFPAVAPAQLATVGFEVLVQDDFVGGAQISTNGQVAGLSSASASGSGGARDLSTGLGIFSVSGNGGAIAPYVSGDGQVIQGYVFGPDVPPFESLYEYRRSGPNAGLTTFPEPRVYSPTGLNGDGSVSIGVHETLGGVRYVGGLDQTPETLGTLAGGTSNVVPLGISENGLSIAGSGSSPLGIQAMRWDRGVLTPLGDIAGGDFASAGLAISPDGSAVVGYGTDDVGQMATRWRAGGMQALGRLDLDDTVSRAVDTSDLGWRVVGYSADSTGRYAPSNPRAFVYDDAAGMQDLNILLASLGIDLTGIILEQATGISGDGQTIVGSGTLNDDFGSYQIAWKATLPIPEPGTAVLLGLGLAGLARTSRKQAR